MVLEHQNKRSLKMWNTIFLGVLLLHTTIYHSWQDITCSLINHVI